MLATLATSSDRTVADLNGAWSGEAQGQPVMFYFLKDGYLGMTVGSTVLDPYNYENDGLNMISVYKTDFSKLPIHIDWMFVKKETDDIMVHREGIIAFSDDDTIYMVMKEKGNRPTDFKGSEVIRLSRSTR